MAWGRKQRNEGAGEVLFDPSKVDAVTLPANESAVELHIFVDAPWTGTDEQIMSLQQKINAYVSFAADGQLAATYPEAASLPWRIVVRCMNSAPDARTARVLAAMRQPVQGYGGDLLVVA